jgi:hypothetical protein
VFPPSANEPLSTDTALREVEVIEDYPKAGGIYHTAQDRLYLLGCLSVSPVVFTMSVVTRHIFG